MSPSKIRVIVRPKPPSSGAQLRFKIVEHVSADHVSDNPAPEQLTDLEVRHGRRTHLSDRSDWTAIIETGDVRASTLLIPT